MGEKRDLWFFHPEKDIRIKLPFSASDIGAACTRFFAFKDAYFLFDCLAPHGPDGGIAQRAAWAATNCLPAWWLWSDGRTEKTCIPFGPWAIEAGWGVAPTAKGLFLYSLDYDSRSDMGPAGGYLAAGDGVRKIIDGWIEVGGSTSNLGVSSDGCRIAFGFAESPKAYRDGYGPRTTRILDVCGENDGSGN